MDVMHETVKVPAPGLREREAFEEHIHEPGFAPAYAAPQIQSALRFPRRPADQATDPPAEGNSVGSVRADQAPPHVIEFVDRRLLCGVGFEASLREATRVDIAKAGSCSSAGVRISRVRAANGSARSSHCWMLASSIACRLVHVALAEVSSSNPAGRGNARAPQDWRARPYS